MKLVVPFVGKLQPIDLRLIQLADFMGIESVQIALPESASGWQEYLRSKTPNQVGECFVVNPRVVKECLGREKLADLSSLLVSRFPHVLVHAPSAGLFENNLIDALSRGELRSVRETAPGQGYEIAHNKEKCGVFSGLSFGPVDCANDRVFSSEARNGGLRKLITVGAEPFMASVKHDRSEVIFIGSSEVVDLSAEVGNAPLTNYFSRLLPHAMALRSIFGERCWYPREPYASVIIDDPLLREKYGFLDFNALLGLMEQHNFHTEIAFIPHNFRRTSPEVIRMLRENAGRFAICFHGNDHLSAEFASRDISLLNTMLQIAEKRIDGLRSLTGLECDRVMVFPQGNFSVEAMSVLKSRNYDAAVNTVPHPKGDRNRLTVGELAQPAIIRYGNFPLFLRKDSKHTESQDIAFDLFFGKPVLIVEHHNIFQHSEVLTEAVAKVNSINPKIHWTNMAEAVSNAVLERRAVDGSREVRAYSRTVQVFNRSSSVDHLTVEWNYLGGEDRAEKVLVNGKPVLNFEISDTGIRIPLTLLPGSSNKLSLMREIRKTRVNSLGLRWNTKAFVRRRLSEARDNYLSKNQKVLTTAQTLQKRLFH